MQFERLMLAAINKMHLMRYFRKTTPKVQDGKVQRKGRWQPTPTYFNKPQMMPAIDRKKPGVGYRHVLLKRHIEEFVRILPDWTELSQGLNAIVLDCGSS